jgi:hypothetical protein
MKNIMAGSGGNGCCWHAGGSDGWANSQCGLSSSDAQSMQRNAGGNWCCASC